MGPMIHVQSQHDLHIVVIHCIVHGSFHNTCWYIAIFSEARRSGAIFGGGPPWAPRHVTSLGAGADAVECRMRPRMQQEKACWRARKPAPAFAI